VRTLRHRDIVAAKIVATNLAQQFVIGGGARAWAGCQSCEDPAASRSSRGASALNASNTTAVSAVGNHGVYDCSEQKGQCSKE